MASWLDEAMAKYGGISEMPEEPVERYIDPRELERTSKSKIETKPEGNGNGGSGSFQSGANGARASFGNALVNNNVAQSPMSGNIGSMFGLASSQSMRPDQSQGVGGMYGTGALAGNNLGNIGAQVGVGLLSSLFGLSTPLSIANRGLEALGQEGVTSRIANYFAPSNNTLVNRAEWSNSPTGLQGIRSAMLGNDAQALENDAIRQQYYESMNNQVSNGGGVGFDSSQSLSDAVSSGNWGGSADSDV